MSTEMRLESVTPEKATAYLSKNKSNRPISERNTERLATAMAAGEWVVNGESIKFNGDGSLVDGQHRLAAIIRSKKTIKTYVVRGLPSTSYDTIDQGKPRSLADLLARAGEIHYCCLASAIRWFLCFKSNSYPRDQRRLSNAALHNFLEETPSVRDSVASILEWCGKQSFPRGFMAGFHCYVSTIDKKAADEFIKGVCTGENLTKQMPEYKLRQSMIDDVSALRKMHLNQLSILFAKSWNYKRTGKEVKVLKTSKEESRPEICQ